MALSTPKELYEALMLIRENEKSKQNSLKRKISSRGVHKEEELNEKDEDEEGGDDSEEGGGDLFGGEDSGDEDSAGEDSDKEEPKPDDATGGKDKKDGSLPGAKELVDTPQQIPPQLKGNDFVDKINKIRAGASLKDKSIQNKIVSYVRGLSPEERNDLWVNLDSLARIILGNLDPAQVMTPSLLNPPKQQQSAQVVSGGKKATQQKKEKRKEPPGASLPIVSVSEGVRKQMVEVPYVIRSNRTVPYGSKKHVEDLETLLNHLMNFRLSQERGSASDASISSAISTVKRELARARRKSTGFEPTKTIDAEISLLPPLIEED